MLENWWNPFFVGSIQSWRESFTRQFKPVSFAATIVSIITVALFLSPLFVAAWTMYCYW